MPETAEQTLHILLLDDHALFRESVSRLLDVEPGFDVVAHCGTIEEALQVLRRTSIDLVLLTSILAGVTARNFSDRPENRDSMERFYVVTAGVDVGAVSELIRSGISGVFRKHDSATLLAQGIRDVMAGKVWLNQEQLQTALTTRSSNPAARAELDDSPNESGTCSHLYSRVSRTEIAARIGVSEGSVKSALQQLVSKTGVRTRSQLVRIVLEQYRDQI